MTVGDDHLLASGLARQAGERLLALRARGGPPGALRDAGDRLSHEYLLTELNQVRPDDAVLSEEGADDPARLSARRVWIIDPLDGTKEFGEPGREDWAVHVALWQAGELAAGAVALPAQDRVLSTAWPARQLRPAGREHLRLLVSRSRPPALAGRLARQLDAVQVPMGSAGAKAAAVITGEADAYVHAGGQFEWDSAAPVAVARAAGLHASRIDGSPLRYNQADPWVPDILICPIELSLRLLSAIRAVVAEESGWAASASPLPSDVEPY